MSDPFSPQSPAGPRSPGPDPSASGAQPSPQNASEPAGAESTLSAAWVRFKSCRWRRPPEDGPECCGHRDVLPLAGTSFNPDAWCPDCAFFKLRRTPKKRSPDEYRY